ncbi:MAG: type II toxin-antitoxin system PrlF family antitoxin [Gammaproteobacteria bacterium]|nr:type II toxin-antitoxin system PrlF family antitoxin [Gammaproteobacteria bacterium]
MSLSTLTSKGQVTIPKLVRDALKLQSGDKIEFVENDSHEFVLKPATQKVGDVAGLLKRYKRKTPVSVDEMDEAIKKQVKKEIV